MARNAQQQLDDLDAAIATIERTGQSISSDGQSLTRASLDAMYRQRERLELMVARETNGRTLVRFPEAR